MGRKKEDNGPRFDLSDPNQFPARFRKCLNGEVGTRGKITNKAFCEATGMIPATVSDYLHGRHGMPYDALIKTADFFGVPVGYLIGHEEKPLALWTDSDKRRIAFNTGLSEEIIEVLHTLRFGKKVSYQDMEISDPYQDAIDARNKGKEISDQDLLDAINKEPEYHSVQKTIYINPNNGALEVLRALLGLSIFEFSDENITEGEWYADETDPKLWSFFDIIYSMIFPQKELQRRREMEERIKQRCSEYSLQPPKSTFVDDPEYILFQADKQFRETIEDLREALNPDYGRDGRKWKESQLNSDIERGKQELKEKWDDLLSKAQEQVESLRAQIDAEQSDDSKSKRQEERNER